MDKEKQELEVLQEYNGKYINNLKEEKNNCYLCSGNLKYYKREDEYIHAVAKLYKKEIETNNKDIKMNKKEEKEKKLILIPKTEKYIEYILQIILKLPRTEKFSIGTEYKTSMYKMLKDILIITKIEKSKILYYLNEVDANLNVQRIYLRIMYKNRWIDEHRFKTAMEQIYELGKILGGLIRYYAKDNKK